MKNNILEYIDFTKIDTLLKGFKNATGLAVAIVDLEKVILSNYQWRKLHKDFYLKNPETSDWDIKIELTEVEKFIFHKYSNGLVEVTIPLLLNEDHFANLFSGYFFFEKTDIQLFKKEAKQYGFDEKKYIDAINHLPVFSLEAIKDTMAYLIETLHLIFEMASDKIKQIELNDSLTINKLFLENIIDNSPALIYVSDLEGKFKLANNEFGQIFRLDKEEIVGKYRQEIMPVAIAAQHRNNDLEVIQLKKSIVTEEENMEADGKHFYISQKFPLFDENGVIHGVGGISTDITDKKRTEEALRKSESKYKSLFNNSADGILVLNVQSEILELNNKICEILDYSREELSKLKGYEFIHSEDLANKDHAAALEQLQQGKTIISQYRLRKKDGSYIPTELSTKMIAEGQFLNIVRDITERKEAEKTLQESEKILSVIFNNHTDLQLLVSTHDNDEFRVNTINKPYIETVQAFGITLDLDTIIGKPIHILNDAIGLGDAYLNNAIANYKKVVSTGKPLKFTESMDIAGLTYISEVTINPIMDENGKCQYILSNSHNITEQTRANSAIIDSEEKFKQIFLTSPDFVSINQIEDGKYIDVNESFIHTSGYSRDEIIGKTSRDINIWTNQDDRNRMFTKLYESGKVENFEAQFTIKNGRIVEGLLSAAILEINNAPHILTITRDITELKQTEQAFKETAANLRSMIDNRDDFIWSIDRDFNYIIFNNTYEKLINNQYNIELKRGMNSRKHLSDEETDFWVPQFESVFEGESLTFEFGAQINDEIRYFQTSLNPIIEDNIITGASGINIDITKRKLIEEALKLSEEKFEKSFRLSPFLITLSSFEGEIIEVNDRIYSTLGYTRDEFLTRDPIKNPLWVDLNNREKYTAILKKEDYVSAKEVLFYKKSGEIGIFSWSACIIELNEIKTCLTIVYDITERKNAEKEIINLNNELEEKVKLRTAQLEAMNKELETFTYSVSHDLKAPLRGIDGYSKLLADIYKPDLNNEAQSFIEKIRTSTLQMNQIIEDLLEYSRLERSQLNIGKVKIKELIESVLSSYNNEFEAGYFKVNTKIPNIEITADAKGFVMAFRNLIENAIKFTKEKTNPTIIIEIEEKELSWIISVNDNGIGFDMKYHHKIFDIFQRLQRVEDFPGTGIGLALVSKAMHRMNGKAWAKSTPSVGSTFYLEIPKNQ